MRIRPLLVAAATLALAACSESSTSPRLSPTAVSKDEATCRSGYHIATRDDGTTSCEPDDAFWAPAASPAAPTAQP
jgi:uncharacterized lipoprotein YajG